MDRKMSYRYYSQPVRLVSIYLWILLFPSQKIAGYRIFHILGENILYSICQVILDSKRNCSVQIGSHLISLWNRKVHDKSRGKVLKIIMRVRILFEMEADKNRRLLHVTQKTPKRIQALTSKFSFTTLFIIRCYFLKCAFFFDQAKLYVIQNGIF